MVNINTTDNLDFLFKSFEKNLYFKSKLLTVEGFQREQYLNIYKHQLINCLVHGHGILYGLEVTKEGISFDKNSKKITAKLSAGAALDCFGRLILVPDSNQVKEAEDTYQPGKLNYLYLVYDEFSAGIASALDETNCDNACTDDYIKETYKLIISSTPPAGLISGKVQAEEKPILGTKIEALDTNKTVETVTFTNELGEYSLFVSAGTYTLQASAPNFKTTKIPNVTITDLTTPIENQNFSLTAASSDSKIQSCQNLTQAYYTDYLRFPPECKDSKVFLAVLKGKDAIEVDREKTDLYRSLVYNNPMLRQLLCDHLADFNNPHRTTAAQVKALQSVNGVGNNGRHVPNIDLESSETQIKILGKKDEDKIDLTLEENAVKRKNLNQDVINRLLTPSDETITVEPDNDNKTIRIRTSINPGITIATGVATFLEIKPRNFNISRAITPFPTEGDPKKMEGVAIVMAVSGVPGANSLVFIGDLETRISNFTLPIITAVYQPEENFFRIFLQDRRQVQSSDDQPVDDDRPIDWKVRWWAIPATKSIEEVEVEFNQDRQGIINDSLLLRIAMQPGVTRKQLLDEGVTTEQLNNLQTNGLITVEGRGNSREYFIKE